MMANENNILPDALRKDLIRRTSYISEADRDTRDAFVDELARPTIEADRKKIGRNDNDTRKRRGSIVNNASASSKTVDKGPWRAGVNRNDRRAFIESDDFTHDVRLYVDGDFADQDEKLAYAKGIADQLNATNQPTEHIKGEPVAYMFADEWGRTKIVLGKETAEYWCPPDENITPLYTAPQPLSESDIPDEPDLVRCAECGAEMIQVRPGKWQHPDCSQSSWAADLVSKTDWNNELSSWSDEDFIRIFHECPDLANRLRKMLAEPVKVDAEALVPSDTDIDELSREWGLASAAYPSKSMVRDFARALLARYK